MKFDPSEAPPKGLSPTANLKRAQEALKKRGYTLTGIGEVVEFFCASVKRDRYGLVPDEAWHRLSHAEFKKFLKTNPVKD
jgi:hypothetical protein